MLHHVREIGAWAVAGPALDDLPGVGDVDVVLGVGIGEHPAFVDHIVPPCWSPPLHRVPLGLMVGGKFHKAEIGEVMTVHIHETDLHTASIASRMPCMM